MDCRNCGAPMELFERRRYYFCQYCGSFHFLDAPATDGVQILTRSPDATPCPACSNPLARSLLDKVHVVEHCERCRGALMPCAAFSDVVRNRRAWPSGPPVPPTPIDQRELQRHITCPSCRGAMDVHPYYGPGNVVIDTCGQCYLVWLDHGELKQIADAPGQDRGRPDPPATRTSVPPEPLAAPRDDDRPMSFMDVLDDLFGSG